MTFLETAGSLPHDGFNNLHCIIRAADNPSYVDQGWIQLGTIPGGQSSSSASTEVNGGEHFRQLRREIGRK